MPQYSQRQYTNDTKQEMGRQDPAARRVSNLSSSQIERKRAIDRANQQHCQQRKKARLQWLETEVARLGTELEVAQSKIKEFEDTCTCGLDHGPDGQPRQHRQQQSSYQLHPLELHRLPSPQDEPASIIPRSHSMSTMSVPPESPSTSSLDRSKFSSVSSSSRSGTAFKDSIWTVNLNELLDPSQQHDKLSNIVFEYPLPPPDTPSPIPQSGDDPEWAVVPLHLPPETDLDRLIFDLTISGRHLQEQKQEQQEQQQQIIDSSRDESNRGGPEELSQAQFPSISSLLNPNLGDDGSMPFTAAMAVHVVQKSTIKSIPARIALMYILSHLMRWLVCRNKQSYDKLPDFLKPTLLQRTVPHPAWVDVVTWPEARDNIIRNKIWQDVSFNEFRRVTGRCMSINWPYADSGAFFDLGLDLGDGQNLTLSPIFEQHIRNADNWSLSKSTAVQFPFMNEFCVGPDVEDE
ncbi:bzip transcription factor [Ophiostoma piceae UAMH 11346]|uniref:Bzip transcription factor n=1 Tax=Ophiostoma piceae (strain UAMH 11346) TaxID=1262450 RepID=S3BQ19_OPHP1|nr:bzip transcription factor [Ophiostoma piceae UAMH 11346]